MYPSSITGKGTAYMNYLELLEHRQSTRKFTSDQVLQEDLEKILLAANGAPVGSNLYRDIHLTVVRDRAILDKLSEAARYRMKDRATMQKITSSIPGQEEPRRNLDPFYGSSSVIFISHRKQDLQPGIEYSNVASIALSMHLEATELGLGSVFMWGALEAMRVYPEYDNTALLELPEGFEPLLGVAVGYREKPLETRNLRLDKIGVNYL